METQRIAAAESTEHAETVNAKDMSMKNIRIMMIAALTAAVVAGCTKEAEPETAAEKQAPAAVDNRMQDEAYVGALQASAAKRDSLVGTRIKVLEEMKAKFAAKQAEMAGADEQTVMAALEADPEWISLEKRSNDLNQAVEDEQRRARELIRQRISK